MDLVLSLGKGLRLHTEKERVGKSKHSLAGEGTGHRAMKWEERVLVTKSHLFGLYHDLPYTYMYTSRLLPQDPARRSLREGTLNSARTEVGIGRIPFSGEHANLVSNTCDEEKNVQNSAASDE